MSCRLRQSGRCRRTAFRPWMLNGMDEHRWVTGEWCSCYGFLTFPRERATRPALTATVGASRTERSAVTRRHEHRTAHGPHRGRCDLSLAPKAIKAILWNCPTGRDATNPPPSRDAPPPPGRRSCPPFIRLPGRGRPGHRGLGPEEIRLGMSAVKPRPTLGLAVSCTGGHGLFRDATLKAASTAKRLSCGPKRRLRPPAAIDNTIRLWTRTSVPVFRIWAPHLTRFHPCLRAPSQRHLPVFPHHRGPAPTRTALRQFDINCGPPTGRGQVPGDPGQGGPHPGGRCFYRPTPTAAAAGTARPGPGRPRPADRGRGHLPPGARRFPKQAWPGGRTSKRRPRRRISGGGLSGCARFIRDARPPASTCPSPTAPSHTATLFSISHPRTVPPKVTPQTHQPPPAQADTDTARLPASATNAGASTSNIITTPGGPR